MDDFLKQQGPDTSDSAETMLDTEADLIEDPEELGSLDTENSPDGENGPQEDVESRLERLERERDEAQAVLARQESARRQAEVQAYWTNTKSQGDAYFSAQEAKIYQEAANAYDPAQFVRQRMAALNKQRNDWTQQYYASREAGYRQAMEQMAVPGYATEVASYYGLGAKEAQRLLAFHPDQMPQVAEMLAEAKGITPQQLRQQAARGLSGSIAPGGSRATGGRKIKAGSDAHLIALFKSNNQD